MGRLGIVFWTLLMVSMYRVRGESTEEADVNVGRVDAGAYATPGGLSRYRAAFEPHAVVIGRLGKREVGLGAGGSVGNGNGAGDGGAADGDACRYSVFGRSGHRIEKHDGLCMRKMVSNLLGGEFEMIDDGSCKHEPLPPVFYGDTSLYFEILRRAGGSGFSLPTVVGYQYDEDGGETIVAYNESLPWSWTGVDRWVRLLKSNSAPAFRRSAALSRHEWSCGDVQLEQGVQEVSWNNLNKFLSLKECATLVFLIFSSDEYDCEGNGECANAVDFFSMGEETLSDFGLHDGIVLASYNCFTNHCPHDFLQIFRLPTIRVYRAGRMSEYTGYYDDLDDILDFMLGQI